jgi:hypothetical protein
VPIYLDRVPAGPFVAWLNREIDKPGQSQDTLASHLGVEVRSVYRWKNSLDGEGDHTDTYARRVVEDVLDQVDNVTFADLYPEIAAAEDLDLEPDGYCGSCHEVVTPIAGSCPWCDRPVALEVPERMFCKREDTTSFPALDGNCWRCGGELRPHMPVVACGCGCGEMIARFDPRGRERKYVRGHAPRSLERSFTVDVEPFALWLEEQLRELDPIEALARRTGLRRELVLAVLNRREETIESRDVRRALWTASRAGQGKGMPSRPGSKKMIDLYPGAVRSTVCPVCGRSKAAHAERCRKCAEEAGAYVPVSPKRQTSLTDDQLQEARELREREGASFLELGRRLQPRTRMSNVESVKNQLMLEFRRRGWPTERLDRRVAV